MFGVFWLIVCEYFLLYVNFMFVFVEGLWGYPIEFGQSPLCKVFCLSKESKEIFSSTPLFYFLQNPIFHRAALTKANK
jgi:hypothetical protein